MFIKIDSRESDVMINMNLLFKEHSHDIKLQQLPLGDIIIENSNKKEELIIERKSLRDLAASIKDGRYNEQSFRLNNYGIHNHNIIYIIEGDLERYDEKKTRIEKKTIYSALITLMLYKGFSVVRTKNVNETCEFVIHMANKMEKEKKRKKFYLNDGEEMLNNMLVIDTSDCLTKENCESNSSEKEEFHFMNNTDIKNITSKHYCEVMKKTKKSNITKENIGEILLSNIPNVSAKSSIAIMEKFQTLNNLIDSLKKDDLCLNNIKIKGEKGNRKITKKCIESIKDYLMQ